jgi:hypothetical protein
MAHLSGSVRSDHIFFLFAQNGSTPTGSFLEKCKLKKSPNQIIIGTQQMSRIYEKMYDDLEGKVECIKKIMDSLPQKGSMESIQGKFANLEKKLKDRKKSTRLSEKCKKDLNR